MNFTSRLRTWPSSCAMTPCNSSRDRRLSSPAVTATAALSGRRPTANAFNDESSMMKTRAPGTVKKLSFAHLRTSCGGTIASAV